MAIPKLPLPQVLITYNDFETVLNHFVPGEWGLLVDPEPEPPGTIMIILDQHISTEVSYDLKTYIKRHKAILIKTVYRYQNLQ